MTTTILTWRDVLDRAHTALRCTVADLDASHLGLATPCADWDVARVVQHAAGDQLAFAMALGVGDGPGYDPFAPSGVLGRTPQRLVGDAIDRTAQAWATVADDAETVPTPLPHGALPTAVAAAMCALDAAVHAWDLAVATGRPSPLTDDLAAALLAPATGVVEPLRQWGAYAAVVPSAAGDTPIDDLLRYLGRVPR